MQAQAIARVGAHTTVGTTEKEYIKNPVVGETGKRKPQTVARFTPKAKKVNAKGNAQVREERLKQ